MTELHYGLDGVDSYWDGALPQLVLDGKVTQELATQLIAITS